MVAGSVGAQTGLPDFGPYRVQELIGRGGMGEVHRAYDTVNERVIALKRLPPSVADREFRARFRREARIVAELRHPNVIPVNDFGEIDGQLYLDMKLVEGTDLRRMLGTGTVDVQRAIAILSQVAQALRAAHESGLVHRDVKPCNILVDTSGHAYLADFGIARATSADATVLTKSGDLVGSWDYMAPERLSRGQIDGRADQYSLACVLFECLTGRLPHPAADPAAKVASHLLQPPPSPSVFVPTITPALDEVVRRGLAKEPAHRFPTSTEFMQAVETAAFAGNTTRTARPTLAGPSKARDQERLVRAIVGRAAAVRTPTTKAADDHPPACPYPGLRGFERHDAKVFFGRESVVTDLLVRLAEQLDTGEPVVLVGASGAGKSSVLRAGLLPALAAADAPDQATWPQVLLTPGRDPVSNLATALAAHTGVVAAEWSRVVRQTPDLFGALCARAIGSDPVRPVIVVDQFEELFTHGVADADRTAFATALAGAHPALVLIAVRADLVERCIELAPLRRALSSPVLLGPMDPTELRQAIVRPARDAGVEVEPGLAERLLADLGVRGERGYDPGALPRLAHALRETWNHGDSTALTLAAYRAAGGIDGAVSRTAEQIHAWLDPSGRYSLRTIMLRLVSVLDDGSVARRRVDPRELAAVAHPGVLDRLIAARLVTVDGTGARLSHEALLTAWPRLRDWIEEDRAGLVQHRRLAEAVRAWTESGGHGDHLYRGTRLATLNSWLDTAGDRVRLQPAEQEFLARSNAVEQAAQLATRRRTRRLRVMVAALSILLVVASVAVFIATELRRTAQDERNRADAEATQNLSRQLAAESTLVRSANPRQAALSALGAWQASPTVEARSALLSAQADHYRGRMTGHGKSVTSVVISADSQIAATASQDGTLRLWDVPRRREIAILGEKGGWYRTVSMSADGRLLAASNLDTGLVTLWNVPDRKLLFTVPEDAADTALSPDGRILAALGGNGLMLWDTRKLTEIGRFPIGGPSIFLKFNQDASLLATTNRHDVEIYRVSDGTKVATLAGHTDDTNSMAFNPAGTLLASSAQDGTVRLWDTRTWTTVRELSMDSGIPHSVLFTPDSRMVVAGGAGTDLYAWDSTTGSAVVVLPTGNTTTFGLALGGHTLLSTTSEGPVTVWAFASAVLGARDGVVTSTTFQPSGGLLATTSGNGAVRLWDRTTGDLVRTLTGHQAGVPDAAFSPDGTRLATTGEDGVVILWDVTTGAEVARFSRPGSQLIELSFSPDGTTIAVTGHSPLGSAEDRDEVLLLNASDLSLATRRQTRREPRNLPQPTEANYPTAVAFSPDGHTLAMSLTGGQIALWDLVDPGGPFRMLPGHPGTALDVKFSPDGTILASGGDDRQVRLWRVRDGRRIGSLPHDAPVRQVVFSPDGATLVTASQDTVLRTWDMRAREPLTRLDRHGDVINDVDVDGTGKIAATASADGVARLWNLDVEAAIRTVCGVLDHETLADEWNAIGPDRGDPPTCSN